MTLRVPPGTVFILAAGIFWCASTGTAQAQCPNPSARVLHIDRQVEYKPALSSAFVIARPDLDVCRGDSVRTGARSRATIVFVDSTRLVIDQNTEWVVREPAAPGRTLIELIRGAILFFTRQPRSLDVQTPFVNAMAEGTEFLIRVEADRAVITVFEGQVAATNPSGSLTLTGNQSAVASQGRAPELQVIARPRDSVQWALHYQPILAEADSLDQLDQIPAAQRDARFYVRRAGLLLGVGRLDEARADIGKAGEDGEASALQAVIAVALNDRAEALVHGREAVRRSPGSAASRIALSYALQANFDLEAARDQLAQAVAEHPTDARAWARLAELWLSLGSLDQAQEAAERAASLAPDDTRANTVLGFAALGRVDTSAARTAFERAIALESDSPLARLGLGLARIRDGDLADGRRDLEIAAALNPDDPIIRSYLGKAYFDEKREPLPGPQFDLAKQLDPLDPTPWFYDAIRKQTLNRPVEALEDLQKSIELNDNRAVYRSRFFLDADLAARSASLARIYRDVGFEQLALVEGWKSLGADPGDYSGHRFLADTYSALPRHEVGRVSELLQAQLLQPLNLTPVSPRLTETDLFILAGAGPGEPAFNEFNSLFARNRIAGQFSGAFGQRSVFGDELTVSGVSNRFSFSVGQFHYDTEGFRENNAQDRDIYNAFVQARLSASSSIQAEFRSKDSVTGDMNLLFNAEDFSRDERIETRSRVGRVGVRHVFSPTSQVIASVYAAHDESDATSSFDQLGESGHVASLSSTDSATGEIRHFFRSRRWNVTTGAGHFQSTRRRDERLDLALPFPPFVLNFVDEFNDDPRQTNVYSYSSVNLSNLSLTLGASADFSESQLLSRSQFNPKFGFIWNPRPATTVRIAAFRTLQRTLVASQTIEPTQIAGFNQFFADSEGEEAWRYGLAVDRKFSDRLFGGFEYSWRELSVPVEIVTSSGETSVMHFDRSEQVGRSYGYWTHGDLAVTAEYVVERFDRNAGSSGSENILKLRTHRVPVGIRYFNPEGWFASGKASYVNQKGEFAALAFSPSGEDSFWVVDTTVGYRFPKRYGRLAFEVKNLFDEQFQFQDTDPGNPVIKPGRLAVLTFTVGM